MVSRKPAAPRLDTNAQSSSANPPYPLTPIDSSKIPASTNSIYSSDLLTSPAFDLINMSQARLRPRRDSDVSSHGTWDSDDDERENTPDENDIPKPLRMTPSKQDLAPTVKDGETADELPAALRPGPANGLAAQSRTSMEHRRQNEEVRSNPWAAQSSPPKPMSDPSNVETRTNNPYHLRAQKTGDSSQAAWSAQMTPAVPTSNPPPPPVEMPATHTPSEELSNMTLGSPSQHREEQPYQTVKAFQVPQARHSPETKQDPLARISEASEPVSWAENPWEVSQSQDQWPREPTPQDKWADEEAFAPPPGPPPGPPPNPTHDGQQPVEQYSAVAAPQHPEGAAQPPPPHPVSGSFPNPTQSQLAGSTGPASETPDARAKRQRSEHYQIKHINWHDASFNSDPRTNSSIRRSPILTQNANGPCPLLALVNALVLSTPQNLDTALVETLRTREQVSLGLLLDAVFDELMSGRRGDTATDLPDVGELYSFLLALHTGMNVNPRFVTPATPVRGSFDGHPPDMHGVHPVHRAQSKPGVFEETREMRLYSTFGIPLVHGWVPPKESPSYAAFSRSAPTFEDAQNIQFAGPELEDKLRTNGLSEQETQMFQDIGTIKQFFENWPTQLTDYGLQAISRNLRPGQIAILFRNDHFSTVYKEPRHGALMTLVTDAGYSSHDEVVWESLVDINGAASDMYSGDFRAVSHGEDARMNQVSATGGGPVQGHYQHQGQNSANRQGPMNSAGASPVAPDLPGPRPTSQQTGVIQPGGNEDLLTSLSEDQRRASEQADHDMALALQLQEEEEEHHRQAEAQRRREQELSERFLSNETERPPAIPPRRPGASSRMTSAATQGPASGTAQGTTTQSTTQVTAPGTAQRTTPVTRRPGVNRPEDRDNNAEAPPSYEQAASDRPYREAGSTAPPRQGNPLNAYNALMQQQQAQAQAQPNSPGMTGNGGRRASTVQRRQSGQPVFPGGYPGQAGGPAQNGMGRGGRPQGAATAQEADERCVVM